MCHQILKENLQMKPYNKGTQKEWVISDHLSQGSSKYVGKAFKALVLLLRINEMQYITSFYL